MPEGPRTIHIFMNFLQCYSLWRTVFEPNHCEYRVDLLNWHEHSCPTFKNAGAKIVLHPLNTMIEYKRFWGDGQSVCHPGWPVYRPGYQGLLFEKSAHGGNFFRLLATARLMAQRYWEGLTSLQRKWTSQYGRPNFRHNCQIGANWRGAPIINFRPLCGRNWRTPLLIVGPAK